MSQRQDTKLEEQGAEFLVLGNLLIHGIQCYKAYTNFRGYDLIAVNPDNGRVARIQVKSRWATDYDRSFPIKCFDCDFVVHVALNRGYRFGKRGRQIDDGVLDPIFYIFPTHIVRSVQNRKDKWGKVTISNVPELDHYRGRWQIIADFLHPLNLVTISTGIKEADSP
jgi:hypothetical protein